MVAAAPFLPHGRPGSEHRRPPGHRRPPARRRRRASSAGLGPRPARAASARLSRGRCAERRPPPAVRAARPCCCGAARSGEQGRATGYPRAPPPRSPAALSPPRARAASGRSPLGPDGRAGSALGRLSEVWRRAARRPDGWGGPGAAEPGGQVGVGSAAGETGSPSRRGPDPWGALAAGVTSQLTFLRRKDKLLWLWVSVSANVFQVLLRLPVLCEAPTFLSRGQGAAAAFVSPSGSAVPPRRRQRTRGKEQGVTLVREEHLSSRLCLLRDSTNTARLYKEAFQPRSPVLNSCHGE